MPARTKIIDAAKPGSASRKLMARFKGQNTRPEILVRKALHAVGLRFRLHRRDLPGTPDIVLPKRKIAIFVHGCFWHHHQGCPIGKIPASRPDFWRAKFERNAERDLAARDALQAMGWIVAEIWECEALSVELEARLRALGIVQS
jgi:DNA mismatch endonuclease, patch repair protein